MHITSHQAARVLYRWIEVPIWHLFEITSFAVTLRDTMRVLACRLVVCSLRHTSNASKPVSRNTTTEVAIPYRYSSDSIDRARRLHVRESTFVKYISPNFRIPRVCEQNDHWQKIVCEVIFHLFRTLECSTPLINSYQYSNPIFSQSVIDILEHAD